MRWAVAFGAIALCAACTPRTVIKPGGGSAKAEAVYVAPGGCNVRDFASATELPQGARNLGWVKVAQRETDEATFIELRNRICEMGGDALSQAAWVKGPSDEEALLTANAWVLP